MTKQTKFVRCSGRKNVTLTALSIGLLLHIAALFSGLYRLFTVTGFANNTMSIKALAPVIVDLYTMLFSFKEIAHIIIFCCFTVWFYCVYRNHHALTRNKTISLQGHFRRFFSCLWRVITFLWIRWLWRPYELASEIWQGNNYKSQIIEPLAFGWWVMVIISVGYGNVSDSIWLKLEKLPPLYELSILRMAILSTLFVDMLWVLTCILSIKLIKGIHARQIKAYEVTGP